MSSRARNERDRRETVEALRKQQKAAERRKTLLVVGIASLIGLLLVGLAAYPIISKRLDDPTKKAVSAFGVKQADAGCDAVTDDPATGNADHVAEGTKVTYKTVPPSSGSHYATPADISARNFYTPDDRPAIETLVHNLEHGYTILWYDADAVKGDQLDDLEGLAERMVTTDAVRGPGGNGKFIVAPLDEARGSLPAGKTVALSHWSATKGSSSLAHRQVCAKVSGEVVAAFTKRFPATDAPEAQTP